MRLTPNRTRGLDATGLGARNNWSRVPLCVSLALWTCLNVLVARAADVGVAEPAGSNSLSLAELRDTVLQHGRTLQTFRIEGTVCAVVPGRNLLALQDASAAVLLEVPILDPAIQAGDEVVVTGTHCAVTRSAFGVQLGTAPVVSNDGHHAAVVKSGNVFLEAGLQPIRVNWFNGVGLSALQVEYEGPGIPRQTIPPTALWRKPSESDGSGPQPGIDFAAFTGNWRFTSPHFPLAAPVARGVATNFDLRYSVRPEEAALEFTGYINIPTTGAYTFYVKSDDGGYLYAGNPAATCCVSPLGHNTAPTPRRFEEALAARDHYPWTQIEGDVVYAAHNDDQLELEVATKRGERIQVAVVEGSSLFAKSLLHLRLRATGVLEALPGAEHREQARLIVPGCGQIDIQNVPEEQAPPIEESAEQLITTAERVRHLSRTVAAQALPGRIRGVVVWKSHEAVVLEDETGGVYIHYSAQNWDEEPAIGDLWEMEGPTDPGDFSPVIMARRAKFLGRTALPEPIRPTWDQLINGSLDAEYVELRGALTTVNPAELDLLMSEGKLRIHYTDDRPLPVLPASEADYRSYVDSIVRIRGCLMAVWDANGQVTAGHVLVSPGTVEVEELAPVNPFALPTRKTSNLLLFDPGANALQRTKVRGQILFGHGDDYRLQDDKSGLRLLTKESVQLQPGDIVEAVGFPQLGGPSLVLQEARVRTIERAALPVPVRLGPGEFVNRGHDSTLVQVEAVLLEDRFGREGQVLELQAGQTHFSAHLRSLAREAKRLEPGSRLLATGVYVSGSADPNRGGSNGFELWLNSPAQIQMLHRPPWWTLRRAAVIVGILSGVLGIALVWITVLRRQVEERTAQLEKQIEERQIIEQRRAMEHERARIAKDIHDDLGASLTRITMLSLSAREELGPSAGPAAKLERVHATARELTRTMAEIVWAVNPRHDTLDSLASYLGKFAQDFLGGADVRCRLQMPLELPPWPLTAEVRHNLFLAFKESLHNVLKHAGAAEVQVSLETETANLVLSVRDDGCGFSPPQTESNGANGSGNGLRNMRQRLEEIGGDCEILSTPDNGCGTEVIFRVPVKGARR
jgi:signal transduction histidine kinase